MVNRKEECPITWESEPLGRIVTTEKTKHNDRVCNSSRGDVEVVAYTEFRLVRIMVITSDCLSDHRSSILLRVAKFYCGKGLVTSEVS